jgi:hypothetical protein
MISSTSIESPRRRSADRAGRNVSELDMASKEPMWEPTARTTGKVAVVGEASEIRSQRFHRSNDGSTHGT